MSERTKSVLSCAADIAEERGQSVLSPCLGLVEPIWADSGKGRKRIANYEGLAQIVGSSRPSYPTHILTFWTS